MSFALTFYRLPGRTADTKACTSDGTRALDGTLHALCRPDAAPRARLTGICFYQDPQRDIVVPDRDLNGAIERVVVEPVVRAVPWDPERLRQQQLRPQASILLISESDVCRSVLAAASLRRLLREEGLEGEVEVATCATRPYNVGEGPEPAAVEAVEVLGLAPPEGHVARLFDPAHDIVSYDLLLVMDKFTAGDVMREVSSFDLVNRSTQFSYKVRRLGEFLAGCGAVNAPSTYGSEGDELDIDDPLYGNYGGDVEAQAVLRAGRTIFEACRGLVAFLRAARAPASAEDPDQEPLAAAAAAAAVHDSTASEAAAGQAAGRSLPPLGPAVRVRVQHMSPTPWLAPPMLSRRVDLEGPPSS